jgi:ATP-dependent exoDNAse (exonuclease V) beta subunit
MTLTDVRLGEVDVPKPEQNDERFWSVTTIIGQLDKPALLYWAAEQAAEAACDQAGYLADRIQAEGREAVVKDLRDARFRKPKGQRSASELGTAVHDACEDYALTGIRPEVDDEVRPFLEQFDKWAQLWQPHYTAAEAAVYSPTYGYAGTLDAIVEIDGMKLLLDYKSTRKSIDSQGKQSGPYPEVALQLSAYRYADLIATWRARRYEQFRRRYYLLNDAERGVAEPMPALDGGVVLHLTPEHATLHPVVCDEAVFEYFQFTIEIARWMTDASKHVVGAPMERGPQ